MPPDGTSGRPAFDPADDPALVAALIAVDPHALGGVILKGGPGPERDAWLAALTRLVGDAPVVRIPFGIADDRLLGGIDLASTIAAGRAVLERGVLAAADGGIAIVAMAERWTTASMQRVCAVLDTGAVCIEREGLSETLPARLGVVALDESIEDDECVPPALTDRLAFSLPVSAFDPVDTAALPYTARDVETARGRLATTTVTRDDLSTLCETARTLGIDSIRAPLSAVRVARVHAALAGRARVSAADLEAACRLCLLPRATVLPAPPEEAPADETPSPEPPPAETAETETPEAPEPPPADTEPTDADDTSRDQGPIPDAGADALVEAALAALPPGLLAAFEKRAGARRAQRRADRGRSGIRAENRATGRARGSRPGDPRTGARLDIAATLRAAAPWQRLRRGADEAGVRPVVRVEDFRIRRHEQRTTTTIVFLVDASGSQAMNRLAEAKGAVESLLADCYVRRDRVALIVFRRQSAELVLPPTRSLVAAKKRLARLPGGGGTPMALGLDAGLELASSLEKRGDHAQLVLVTDGRANVTRAGEGDPERAGIEAYEAARAIAAARLDVLVIDASPRPRPAARELAGAMQADYLALPYADGAAVGQAVRATLDAVA